MAGKKNYIALTGLFHESKTVPRGEKVLLNSEQAKNLLELKAVCLPDDYSDATKTDQEPSETETNETESENETQAS